VTGLVAGDDAQLCVAGVALGDIYLGFAWQASRLVTSTFVLRGKRGTYGTGLALVARLGWDWWLVTPRHFAWQAWHLATSTFVSRSRRGAWRHLPSFCVAGVALMAMGWLWWRAWLGLVAGDAAALCVAGVALRDIHLRFTWQAWHLETSTFVLRGRHGTYGTGLALVALLAGTPLSHTPPFTTSSFTHNFVTHHLFFYHTIFHT